MDAMFLSLLQAVTLLGNSALLLPLAGLFAILLWRRHSLPAAVAWIGVLLVCAGVLAMLKVAGHACDFHVFDARLTSPSGHAALSATVYGAVGLVAARRFDGWRRRALLLAVVGVVGAVGLSRVVLGMHSAPEVVVGLALGAMAVAVFAQSLSRFGPSQPNLNPLLIAMVVLAGIVGSTLGDQSLVEPVLQKIAALAQQEAVLCGAPPTLTGALMR